ncbi:MAG: GNAT family N-acetyltransferase [Oscillospiraceae bacterium]|nr:GNAT family N-acetyltransferase [Oscillospiraceae bacterium]
MIRAVTGEDPGFLAYLQREDVFAAYIDTRYRTFGQDLRRVAFWKQEEQAVTGAASLNDGELILCGDFDPEELCAFVGMSGCRSVTGPYRLLSPLSEHFDRGLTARTILKFSPERALPPGGELFQPRLEEVFSVLSRVFEELRDMPFDMWYTTVSHKVRHGLALVAGEEVDGVLAATAGIYNQNSGIAVLGAVATLPEYRGRGCAGRLVSSLALRAMEEGRAPYIVSKNDHARRLYEKLGFAPVGQSCAMAL